MTEQDHDFSAPTLLSELDKAMTREGPREHLGMSEIGKKDERSLWLKFRWCLIDDPEPRTKRIFRLGNILEEELIHLLRQIPGVELLDLDEDGNQFRFSFCGGHFGGSMDGAILGIPEAPKTWHVFEAKSVSGKRFKELKEKRVEKWSPEYFAQLQCYMGASGMERALFCAYNKDTSEIYIERVKPVKMFWSQMQAKAERIITADEPPATTWPNEQWYESKFLSPMAQQVYWTKRAPMPNCRNCRFSQPVDGGWACDVQHTAAHIPYEKQLNGCKLHNFIPALVPAQLVDTGDGYAEYVTEDGAQFWNVADGDTPGHAQAYSSKELACFNPGDFSKAFIEDPTLSQFRTDFDATLIEGETA